MVRQILLHNRYFAIWPEGYPNGTGRIQQGFNSIVKVYSTINTVEDRIPFMPVLLRGSNVYLHNAKPHTGPIEIHFLDPYYLPREWITPDHKDFKTPREIIDIMMMKIARYACQSQLDKNRVLEHHKHEHNNKGK
jgi:hypothetical protein